MTMTSSRSSARDEAAAGRFREDRINGDREEQRGVLYIFIFAGLAILLVVAVLTQRRRQSGNGRRKPH